MAAVRRDSGQCAKQQDPGREEEDAVGQVEKDAARRVFIVGLVVIVPTILCVTNMMKIPGRPVRDLNCVTETSNLTAPTVGEQVQLKETLSNRSLVEGLHGQILGVAQNGNMEVCFSSIHQRRQCQSSDLHVEKNVPISAVWRVQDTCKCICDDILTSLGDWVDFGLCMWHFLGPSKNIPGNLAGVFIPTAYLLDMQYWRFKNLRRVFIAAFVMLCLGGALYYSEPVPVIPVALASLLLSLLTQLASSHLRSRFGKDYEQRKRVSQGEFVGFRRLLIGVVVIWGVWFPLYIRDPELWTTLEEKVRSHRVHGVVKTSELYGSSWLAKEFVEAFSPLIVSAFLACMSVLAWKRGKTRAQDLLSDDGTFKEVPTSIVVIIAVGCAMLFLAWISEQIFGEITPFVDVIVLVAALMTAVSIYTMSWVGNRFARYVQKLLHALGISTSNEWLQAVFVLIIGPLLPLYFIVEVVHQCFRRFLIAIDVFDRRVQRGWTMTGSSCCTQEALLLAEEIWSWRWGTLFAKSMLCGLAYFVVQAAMSTGLMVVLAWVREAMASWSLVNCLILLFLIVMALWLFPPVSGLPLYVTGSLVLIPHAQKNGYGWHESVALASFFNWSTKLLASAIEQKAIGEPFSRSIPIKYFVGIHTPFMKAVKKILSQQGLSVAKSAVLCGAPDWPTSVLTGILRLPLLETTLGTSPVIFIIVPTAYAAAFMLQDLCLQDPLIECTSSSTGKSLSTMFMILAAALQGAATFLAAYFVQSRIGKLSNSEQLELADADEDKVLAHAEQSREAVEIWAETIRWEKQPKWLHVQSLFGTLLASVLFYICIIPGLQPFQKFNLTDSVSSLEGGVASLIGNFGRAAIILAGCVLFCLLCHLCWCWSAQAATPPQNAVRRTVRGDTSQDVDGIEMPLRQSADA